jgi:ferredoxin
MPIKPDSEPDLEKWLAVNAEYAAVWPNISSKHDPLADADDWKGKPDKGSLFSPSPGLGD